MECVIPLNLQYTNTADSEAVSIALAVSRHAKNPWIIPRLIKQTTWHESCPYVNIADCSDIEFSLGAFIHEFSSRTRILHQPAPFNIARLRNIAVAASSTPWIFATDPDFFTSSDFFPRIIQFARDALAAEITPFFTFPVYHASKVNTDLLESTDSIQNFNSLLSNFFIKSSYSKISKNCEFIAPYANIIFTTKKIFDATGGYNENFSGYGSEDFEFLIRTLMICDVQPLPKNIFHDVYKPTRDDYYKSNKKYTGFRKYLETYSFPVEIAGFKFVHLWHPHGTTPWHALRDKNRKTLRAELSPILADPTLILEKDWLPRPHHALAVITKRANWRFFLPLRCQGYKIHRFMLEKSHDAQDIMACARNIGARLIAFSEDAACRQDTARILAHVQRHWPETSIMTNEDQKKIGIHPLRMDEKSYTSARIGLTHRATLAGATHGLIKYIVNKYYDMKYIFFR